MNFLKKHPGLFLGLGIMILFLGLWFVRFQFVDTLELKYYDVVMKLRGAPDAESDIVMVDIDEDSIEKLGRWPWPRSLLSKGILKINEGKPKVIGLNLLLTEAEVSEGLREIESLEKTFEKDLLKGTGQQGKAFLQELQDVKVRLDNDKKLTEAFQSAGNVVLPVFFRESAVAVERTEEPDAVLVAQSIQNVQNEGGFSVPRGNEIVLPVPSFFATAKGIGHFNLSYDMDGTARRERLLYEYDGLYFPSYTLRVASLFLNIPMEDISAELGSGVYLGSQVEVPTTLFSEMLISFKGPRNSFRSFSYFDVINDKIPVSVFKNKLVLVSPSAAGIMNPLSTPTDPTMPVGEFSAHTIWAILNRAFIQKPPWAEMAELIAIVFIGLIIAFVLPRLKALYSGIVFAMLLLLFIGGTAFAFVSGGTWIPSMYPLIELIIGYIGVVSLSYFVTEADRDKVEGESAETNRMLGLSFQSQGMLDMAFDKLRRVPVNDEMKDILYNLALDYERKRQFNKAASVYEYIEENDSKFKDVSERKKKLLQASDTMVFGDGFFAGGGRRRTYGDRYRYQTHTRAL